MNYFFKIFTVMVYICLIFSCEKDTAATNPNPSTDIPYHAALLEFTEYGENEIDVPLFLTEAGLEIDEGKGIFLSDKRQKSNDALMEAYPVVNENLFLTGFLWKGHNSNNPKYVSYNQFIETIEKYPPKCETELNLLASMFFFIETYQFRSVPHKSVSIFLEEVSMLSCNLNKNESETVAGQYIEYTNGYASGVVAYDYTVTTVCESSGDTPDDPFDEPDDDSEDGGNDENGGGGNNSNNDNNNDENEPEDPIVKAKKIRDFLVEECGYSYDDFGRLNGGAGAAFEQAVLATYGFNQNTQMFDSPVRASITNGQFTRVQPDAVTQGVWTQSLNMIELITGEDEIVFVDDANFVEVKAYSGTVNLSTSDYQILGEIDAVAEEFYSKPASERGNLVPAFYLFTLGDVSNGVTTYCNDRNVQFFHGKIAIDDNNMVTVTTLDQKNSVAGYLNLSYLGRAIELECPPGSPGNRLDPEVLNDNP